MTPAWVFLVMAVLMALAGVALSWAGAVRRKRYAEEFLVRRAEKRAKACN
jgi:hypothetical protein